MELEEYKVKLRKAEGKGRRVGKVRNCWGSYDAYKHIRKNHWFNIGRPVTEKEFYAITRGINDLLVKEVIEGKTVVFPARMGYLELHKKPCGAKVIDGKLKITYPVDWAKTVELWYQDKEAEKNKTLIRHEVPYIYKVRYKKFRATYENKGFYDFVLNRFAKKALSRNIKQGKVDTLW